MEAVEEIKYKDYIIKIFPDTEPRNPREDDNLGTMVCKHNSYMLGNVQAENTADYTNWNDWFSFEISKKNKHNVVSYPLYLLDHSGLRLNVDGFYNCDPHGWDWGQVGYIYCTYKDIREEFGIKKISPKRIAKAKQILLDEVHYYDCYLSGDCYCYGIYDRGGNELHFCGGFFPERVLIRGKNEYQYIIDEAKNVVDVVYEDRKKKCIEENKQYEFLQT